VQVVVSGSKEERGRQELAVPAGRGEHGKAYDCPDMRSSPDKAPQQLQPASNSRLHMPPLLLHLPCRGGCGRRMAPPAAFPLLPRAHIRRQRAGRFGQPASAPRQQAQGQSEAKERRQGEPPAISLPRPGAPDALHLHDSGRLHRCLVGVRQRPPALGLPGGRRKSGSSCHTAHGPQPSNGGTRSLGNSRTPRQSPTTSVHAPGRWQEGWPLPRAAAKPPLGGLSSRRTGGGLGHPCPGPRGLRATHPPAAQPLAPLVPGE
jgi:hypothetical protein